MQKRNLTMRQRSIRFSKFTRKGYGLFSVLGREVLIGTLSVATLTHARAESVSVKAENAKDSLERKELKLDEVVVTGSRAPLTQLEAAKIVSVILRDDIDRAAAESVNDILKLATGVDVRQRGSFGVQTDISVRGGNFDQITILLNGVNISSPHTGHLSADFPVSVDDIERIEVLEGPAARVYGTSAFNGVVNIITRTAPAAKDGKKNGMGGYVNVSGGSYGYFNANGGVGISHRDGSDGTFRHSVSGGYSRSDGAVDNSFFSSSRVFYNGCYENSDVRVDAQVGYSYKPYAANTFYGAASRDQWESNERWMAAVKAETLTGRVHLQPTVYWNRWNDHYQWHKGMTPGGENFHQVDVYGVGLNSWFVTKLGKTSIGVDMRNEGIWSTNLGKPLTEDEYRDITGHDSKDTERKYTRRDQRTNVSAFVEHDIVMKDWTVSFGVLANRNTNLDERWRLYPGIDVAYRPTDNWKIMASWNMALRMPTFTDLYYSGANIEGNSNLKPEKTSDVQLGARYSVKGFIMEAQAFYSHKTDMIDWVTYTTASLDGTQGTDGVFHSVNFKSDNLGYEVGLQWLPRELYGKTFPLRKVGVQYSYINEDSKYDVNVVASKYAMEYLRHKVVASADGTLWKNLTLGLDWRWQARVGQNNAPYALLDSRLAWDAKKYSIYLNATNILCKEYYDYVSVKQPGFCFMAGAKVRF